MPTQRSHSHLARQVSCSKISPVVGACGSNLSSSTTGLEPSNTATSSTAYSRYSTDLCTIPQDEVLPPMDVPLEKRFAHEEWDDEDE
ncbi:hypothetical protein BGZ58_009585 [Dissophora ornata]|nr:hypothetical protein BGZ58_009585 [Dissophora ornata]